MLWGCIMWAVRAQRDFDLQVCRRILSHNITMRVLYNCPEDAEWLDAKLRGEDLVHDFSKGMSLIKKICASRPWIGVGTPYTDVALNDFLMAHMVVAFPGLIFGSMNEVATDRIRALQKMLFDCSTRMLSLYYDVCAPPLQLVHGSLDTQPTAHTDYILHRRWGKSTQNRPKIRHMYVLPPQGISVDSPFLAICDPVHGD